MKQGAEVEQWLRYRATNRKVASSNPQSQQTSYRRPTPLNARPRGQAFCESSERNLFP